MYIHSMGNHLSVTIEEYKCGHLQQLPCQFEIRTSNVHCEAIVEYEGELLLQLQYWHTHNAYSTYRLNEATEE